MNRKLRDTLIALSTSGLLLVVGLLAGDPQSIQPPQPAYAALAGAPERANAIDAGASPLQGLRHAAPRRASGHRKLALPYFSFAQNARRGGS